MNLFSSLKPVWVGVLLSCLSGIAAADVPSADELIRLAMNHWRGVSSYSDMTMTVHRSDWQRTFSMQAWTQGEKNSLVRVTEPKRDAGNGTLILDKNMWSYTPKVNRIIKIPSSMMSQSWMGSDFSNKDISKDTAIIKQYHHTLVKLSEHDGHQVYVIQSIPHKDAAVVWGREVLRIRDDWVILERQFWDQEDVLVKTLKSLEIRALSGRNVATVLRMETQNTPEEWTEVRTTVEFDVELPANLFTMSNLRNPLQ